MPAATLFLCPNPLALVLRVALGRANRILTQETVKDQQADHGLVLRTEPWAWLAFTVLGLRHRFSVLS